jgi:hypothetical protein
VNCWFLPMLVLFALPFVAMTELRICGPSWN